MIAADFSLFEKLFQRNNVIFMLFVMSAAVGETMFAEEAIVLTLKACVWTFVTWVCLFFLCSILIFS